MVYEATYMHLNDVAPATNFLTAATFELNSCKVC